MKAPAVAIGSVMPSPGLPIFMERRLWGAVYEYQVISDSGVKSDLDKVKFSEVVKYVGKKTGIFTKDPSSEPIVWQNVLPPPGKTWQGFDYNGRHTDARVGTPMSNLVQYLQNRIATAGNGEITGAQYFIFADLRTGMPTNADGSGSEPILASAFTLTERAEKTNDGKYYIRVARVASSKLVDVLVSKGVTTDDTEQSAEIK